MARILFLQNVPFEYMGPMYLSAHLKRHGHDCRLLVAETVIARPNRELFSEYL